MQIPKTLKSAALAGLIGLGFAAAIATPAKADHVYTRCDRDGDRCWRVRCDWDGDDCRRIPIYSAYDPSWRYDRRTYDPDRERFYRYHHYDYRRGMWVCDGSSEYCRWSARRW